MLYIHVMLSSDLMSHYARMQTLSLTISSLNSEGKFIETERNRDRIVKLHFLFVC